jgi:2,4-dienoyl-CoA reductase-like NADH-dependent reductase (Old Yellow Enzyme family)
MNPDLFAPLTLRGLTLPNRIVVSPMCQYSSEDGFSSDWHVVHIGSRAVGGAGLVIMEASAVSPEGRISPGDHGIWKDAHIEKLRQITTFCHTQKVPAGIQLAHAGRKASMSEPWLGEKLVSIAEGGWETFAPSAIAFAPHYSQPTALTIEGIKKVIADFRSAAQRALTAGFDLIEIHAAHGYLLHEFLSPLSNHRTDEYGGSFDNRIRPLLEVVAAVREVWPESHPLFVRISATDWADGGWNPDASVELAKTLKGRGVDLIDCSSAALVPGVKIPVGPGFQTPFADRIRREGGIPTGAVGMITDPAQADQIIRNGQADIVLLARELLRDPYWPMHAAAKLGKPGHWPVQYLRAAPHGSEVR